MKNNITIGIDLGDKFHIAVAFGAGGTKWAVLDIMAQAGC
jgi:hypothetical protein